MRRKDLKNIDNLSKKQIEGIMILHQIDIIDWNKKIDIKDKQINNLKEELACLKGALNEMNINKLKQEARYWKEKYIKDIKQIKFDCALNEKISNSKVKDPVLLKSLLDINKLEYRDGKLWGFDKQIEKLKHNHPCLFIEENQYLFLV